MPYSTIPVRAAVSRQSSGWVLALSISALCVLLAVFMLYSWGHTQLTEDNDIARINKSVVQSLYTVADLQTEGLFSLGQLLASLSDGELKTEGQDALHSYVRFPGIFSISYIGPDGRVFLEASSRPGFRPDFSMYSRQLSEARSNGKLIQESPVWIPAEGEWLFPLFLAVRKADSDGVPGVLSVLTTLNSKLMNRQGMSLERDTSIVIVGQDGFIRYALPELKRFNDSYGRSLMQHIVRQIDRQGGGEGWLDAAYENTSGRVEYRVHYEQLEPDLYSLVLRPRAVYRQALLSTAQPAFIIFFLLLAGVVVVHVVVLRQQQSYRTDLLFQARHDPLTGLYNRSRLLELMNNSIRLHPEQPLTLVLINLDQFNQVNDKHGHPVGDEVLRQVPQRLQTVLSEGDWIARHSGDEFMVVFRDPLSLASQDVLIMALMAALQDEFEVGNRVIRLTACAGVATYPYDSSNAEELLGKADAALHKAKADGRCQLVSYSCALAAEMQRAKKLEHELEGCWARDEIYVHYQPQVNCHSGELIGAEALVRWCNHDLGNVSPAEFIPVAEATGIVSQIDRYVMQQACVFIRQLSELCQRPLRISVNLSPAHLLDPGMFDEVSELLSRFALEPQQLVLEITETAMLNDFEKAVQQVSQLRSLGVGVSVDDFGTGYSSLAYIHKLPVTEIKIDRSFVDQICTDLHDRALTSAIIAMGKRLHLEVVAEGVEDAEQWRILAEQNCDSIQGYYVSRPMTAGDFMRFAADNQVQPPQPCQQVTA